MQRQSQKIEQPRSEGCGALFAVELVRVTIAGPCFEAYDLCRACAPDVLQRLDAAHEDAGAELEAMWRRTQGGA